MQQTTSIKPLTPVLAGAGSPTNAYTSPDANTSAIIKHLRLYNGSTADVTIQIWAVPFGGSPSIANQLCNQTIRGYQTIAPFDHEIMLGPQWSLEIQASTAAVVGLNGTYFEFQTVA